MASRQSARGSPGICLHHHISPHFKIENKNQGSLSRVVNVEVDAREINTVNCPGRSAVHAQIFWLIENSLLNAKGSDTWPELVAPQINCFHRTVL